MSRVGVRGIDYVATEDEIKFIKTWRGTLEEYLALMGVSSVPALIEEIAVREVENDE